MYRWQENGKTKSVYSMDLGELREKEFQIQKDIKDGINSYKAESLSVNSMFKKWIERQTGNRDTTINVYKQVYRNRVKKEFGDKKIDMVLKPLFDIAAKDDIIRKNPCNGVLSEICNKCYGEKPHRHSLTAQEQENFIDYLTKKPIYNKHLPVFAVLFRTGGGRVGEILGMTWNDIDFKNNTICINHTLGYNSFDGKMRFFINKPKTKAGNREIPMLKDVREILLKMREERHKTKVKTAVIDGYTDFVFVTRTGNPISYVNLNHLINNKYSYRTEKIIRNVQKKVRE